MPRKRRSELPPVTVGIARSQRWAVRPTPNGGWAWKCSLCDAYAELMDTAGHKLCGLHAQQDVDLLRAQLLEAYRGRTGKWPKSVAEWGRTHLNDNALRAEMLRRLGIRV